MGEINVNKPLVDVDIVEAIAYYGVNEVLDTIGMKKIEQYLVELEKDVLLLSAPATD